jgi:hypothetical protein
LSEPSGPHAGALTQLSFVAEQGNVKRERVG